MSSALSCPQCGAEMPITPGQNALVCAHCSAAVAIDRSTIVLHRAVARSLSPEEAAARLKRWMAGDQAPKGLDVEARIIATTPTWFPLWYLRVRREGSEVTHLEPAAHAGVDLSSLKLPAGALIDWTDSVDGEVVAPTVALDAAAGWVDGEVLERLLVHVPLVAFRYQYAGKAYTAVVDAAAGDVYATAFPKKREGPYCGVATLGCLVYFTIAWIPVFATIAAGGYTLGAPMGLLAWAVAAVIVTVPVGYLASRVARAF